MVWGHDGDRPTLPTCWAYAGSKATIMGCFRRAVAIAGKKNWRRVAAVDGDYPSGTFLAEVTVAEQPPITERRVTT